MNKINELLSFLSVIKSVEICYDDLTINFYDGNRPGIPYEDGSDGCYCADRCFCNISFNYDYIAFLNVAAFCIKYFSTIEYYKDQFPYDINAIASSTLNDVC